MQPGALLKQVEVSGDILVLFQVEARPHIRAVVLSNTYVRTSITRSIETENSHAALPHSFLSAQIILIGTRVSQTFMYLNLGSLSFTFNHLGLAQQSGGGLESPRLERAPR